MPRQPSRVPDQTKCQKCPLRHLPAFRPFEAQELQFVEWFKTGELVANAGATILSEGHNSPHLFTILSGWAFRYKTLVDGRRQILNFAVSGDFLGLQSAIFEEMQHSVEALTDIVLCVFPRDRLWHLYEKYPSLSFDITWLAARSERLLDDHLVSLGRRSAPERMAYVLLLLYDRAHDIGLDEEARVRLPVTQQHLADALGLSLVHTNKTLKGLAVRKLIEWRNGYLKILDRERLVELSLYERDSKRRRPLI